MARNTINQKGQAFESFRLLIAMVIALAVLMIIVSAINYFDALRQKVSFDTLNASWQSAVDSPNGKVVRASNLSFTLDTRFSRTQFAKQAGLDPACLQFDAEKAGGFQLDDSDPEHPYVYTTGSIVGTIFMSCQNENFIIPPGPDSCFVYCLVSFGKTIGDASTP